jgi:hypothetical protein
VYILKHKDAGLPVNTADTVNWLNVATFGGTFVEFDAKGCVLKLNYASHADAINTSMRWSSKIFRVLKLTPVKLNRSKACLVIK